MSKTEYVQAIKELAKDKRVQAGLATSGALATGYALMGKENRNKLKSKRKEISSKTKEYDKKNEQNNIISSCCCSSCFISTCKLS